MMPDRFTGKTQPVLPVYQDQQKCYDIVYSSEPGKYTEALENAGLKGRRSLIVTDSNVAPLYAEKIASMTEPRPEVYVIPAGEENKTLDEIRRLLRYLVENHYDRRSYLIALGGGVVGDMTGFAAAIFMRGIDFIQIPTTLLSQADSSIGGKTGVDMEGFKNMVGAFKMPRLVFADVNFLKTLDGRQFASGFAEIMKHGLILDSDYYVWLLENMYEITDRDPDVLRTMLYRSNEIKKYVVEADPYEKNERMLLNFGHTIGHAIEKYRNFSMTHGECVALGCVAAAYISWKAGYIPMEEYYEIRDMFVPFGLPISEEGLDAEKILALMRSDKKAAEGKIRFILLHGIGDAFIEPSVSDEQILAAINEINYVETGD